MSEINVVPYIDVMLVLLIIFMITAPLLTQGISVDLPNAPAPSTLDPELLQDNEPLVLSVDREGRFYLNVGDERGSAGRRCDRRRARVGRAPPERADAGSRQSGRGRPVRPRRQRMPCCCSRPAPTKIGFQTDPVEVDGSRLSEAADA